MKVNESAQTYPLSAALRDLEDYYRAGTITSLLIQAVGDAGAAANDAAEIKATVLVAGAFAPNENTSRVLRNYLLPGDRANIERWSKFNQYLKELGYRFDVGVILTKSSYAGLRALLIKHARDSGEGI